jgi:tight adherence protein C
MTMLLGWAWGIVAAGGSHALIVRRRSGGRARRLQVTGNSLKHQRFRVPIPPSMLRLRGAYRDRRLRKRHHAALLRGIPLTVDLLALGVTAGLTPYLALCAACHAVPDAVAEPLQSAIDRVGTGTRLAVALDQAVADEPALRPVVSALLASERLGAPVGPALLRVAAESRAAARRRAEVHARRVPVRLLFPLVFLVLPAFALLTVVPAVASGFAR